MKLKSSKPKFKNHILVEDAYGNFAVISPPVVTPKILNGLQSILNNSDEYENIFQTYNKVVVYILAIQQIEVEYLPYTLTLRLFKFFMEEFELGIELRDLPLLNDNSTVRARKVPLEAAVGVHLVENETSNVLVTSSTGEEVYLPINTYPTNDEVDCAVTCIFEQLKTEAGAIDFMKSLVASLLKQIMPELKDTYKNDLFTFEDGSEFSVDLIMKCYLRYANYLQFKEPMVTINDEESAEG